MNQVAQYLPNEAKSAVEIVVYISKDLGDEQRNLVVAALEKTTGIVTASSNTSSWQLVQFVEPISTSVGCSAA